jgi:DNA mismatch endonuclease (patch repair protein)
MPQDNRRYWQAKISRNAARDRATTRLLRQTGWRVLQVWENELENESKAGIRVLKLRCCAI